MSCLLESCADSPHAAVTSRNHKEDLHHVWRCLAAGSRRCVQYYFGGYSVVTADGRLAASQRHLAVHE